MLSNSFKIEYSINTATTEEVFEHLTKCDKNFEPSLSDYVNIEEYSNKISNYATKIEAWHEKKLVGLIAIYLNDIEHKIGFITSVSVLNDYQGMGVSKEILKNTINKAETLNFKTIKLEVYKNNKKAISLYQIFRFEIVNQTSDKFTMNLFIN